MKTIKQLAIYSVMFLALVLFTRCSKSNDAKTENPSGSYIRLTIDGEEIMMTHLAVMSEKENKTWNLNALSGGGENSLKGRKAMTINIRDKDGTLATKTYQLDNGSAVISASFTEFLNDTPDTQHWSASTGSAWSDDQLTVTFSSLNNGVAKGTFSGRLHVSSGGNLKTTRTVTKGEFSLSMK